jgi:hypothetical protein
MWEMRSARTGFLWGEVAIFSVSKERFLTLKADIPRREIIEPFHSKVSRVTWKLNILILCDHSPTMPIKHIIVSLINHHCPLNIPSAAMLLVW